METAIRWYGWSLISVGGFICLGLGVLEMLLLQPNRLLDERRRGHPTQVVAFWHLFGLFAVHLYLWGGLLIMAGWILDNGIQALVFNVQSIPQHQL